jgi:glycosyltransferase involved in cell wall biosynthesis
MVHLSVVIPVLNESSLIEELTKRVKLNIEKITSDYEILLIDDGSTDETWDSLVKAANLEKKIRGIKFSRNFGHHYAITAGIHKAKGDWVIVMDGDLQDRPEVIPDLYRKSQEGFDVVFVSRQNRPEKIGYRIAQRIFYFVLNLLSGIKFDSRQANFSIISRKVVDAFIGFPEYTRFYGSTILWLGFNRTFIVADHGNRFSGSPSYTLKKRLLLAADIILSFSERPLKFAIYLGLFISSLSIFGSFWILIRTFKWGYSVIGWPSLMVTIFFLGGVTLTILGLIGIYLGRVFQQVKNRPLYIISSQIN